MSKYLIFGATGSIGTSLSEQLSKSNKEIHLIGRKEDELESLSAKLDCDYSVLDILSENLSEFVKEEFRELSLGTFLLNSVRTYVKSINSQLRTITLPSDRVAKNFYEASGITARVLLMEEKRENNRYRP